MGLLSAFFDTFQGYFQGFGAWDYVLLVFDMLIVAVLVYYALVFIRGTRASKIVYGIATLLGVAFIGRLLNLETLNWLLEHLTTVVIVAIPIVFQPELRRALERLGRTTFVSRSRFISDRGKSRTISELVEAVRILQVNEIGALIVFQKETGLNEYIEQATELNAKLTSELLLSIFFPKSPLHDGAVILSGETILAASAILPVSENKKSFSYGTRHRAAMGITEVSDAFAVTVSEERGVVSLVRNGKIQEVASLEQLEKALLSLL